MALLAKFLTNKANLALLFILVTFFALYLSLVVPAPIAPDELSPDFFSSLLIDNSEFGYVPIDNVAFENGFKTTPGGFYFNPATGEYVSGAFPGFIYLSALLKSMGIGFYYINPILAVLGLLLLYCAVKRLFNARIALVTIVLLGISPIYVHWSVLAYQDMSSLIFLFLIGYLSIVCFQKNSFVLKVIIGLSIGWWIFMRYTNVVYLASLLPLALALLIFKKKKFLYGVLPVVISLSICLVFIFLFNEQYYNSWVTIPSCVVTGESLDTGFYYTSDMVFGGSMLERFYLSFKHMLFYSNFVIPLYFIGIISMMIGIVRGKEKLRCIALICLLFLIVGCFFFYSNYKPFYWESAHFSPYRYLLPAYTVIVTLIAIGINSKTFRKFLRPLFVTTFIVISISYIFTMPFNSYLVNQSKLAHLEIRQEIETIIPADNSVIFTGFFNKVIPEGIDIVDTEKNIFGQDIVAGDLVSLVDQLLLDNQRVWWIPNAEERNDLESYFDGKYNMDIILEQNVLNSNSKTMKIFIFEINGLR